MPFYEIEFPLACLSQDATEGALERIGALSVTYVDRADDEPILEPKPGEMRLWRDTLVRALFDRSADPPGILQALSVALGPAAVDRAQVREIADQAWERVWLRDWQPMRFGKRLWVAPTHAEPGKESGAGSDTVVVRLDPGLAFGTGSHPTTALCLTVLDSLDLKGRSVIDYGCGSGILGIAALKLGASRVLALDIDRQALIATRENAARNEVAIEVAEPGAAQLGTHPLPPADCVLANILAGPLVELAPQLTALCRAGADLVLSGLLHSQTDAVIAAYAANFDMLRILTQDEWCCIHARRGT